MAGTVSDPIFYKDGQYLTFTATAALSLGNCVALDSDTADYCIKGVAAARLHAIGVAVSTNRVSRTMTDGIVAAGQKVTVCTRGIVNVRTDNSAILIGSLLELGADGKVTLHTDASADYRSAFAMALEENSSTDATVIKVKLLRG